jgi:hypothetical protein
MHAAYVTKHCRISYVCEWYSIKNPLINLTILIFLNEENRTLKNTWRQHRTLIQIPSLLISEPKANFQLMVMRQPTLRLHEIHEMQYFSDQCNNEGKKNYYYMQVLLEKHWMNLKWTNMEKWINKVTFCQRTFTWKFCQQ